MSMALRKPARQATARIKTYAAPVKGWNARDQVDQIDDLEAARLDNFFPRPNKVELRRGIEVFSRAVNAPVETIMEFSSQATRKMVVAGNGKIYSVSDAGVGTSLASGFTEDRHSWLMFKEYLLTFNGAETPQKYDGTTWAANSFSGSGLTQANLVAATAHRTRLLAWEAAKPWFWYGGTDSISGTLTKFDLAKEGVRGGNLVAIASWTRDSGNGTDDLAVFFMSQGEAIVYKGSNPGDADNWSKVGVFPVAAPISRHAIIKLAGDVVYVSKDGILSLETVLPLGGTKRYAALSDKISGAFLEAVTDYDSNAGWQLIHYPRGPMLVCNVPVAMADTGQPETYQLVMNTDTGAWAKFTGLNLRCLGMYADELYAGGETEGAVWDEGIWDVSAWASGLIVKIDSGAADIDIDSNGNVATADIVGRLTTKHFGMGADTLKKRFTMVRPVLESGGALSYQLALSCDYDPREPSWTDPTVIEAAGAAWDTGVWDVAEWGADTVVHSVWRSAGGLGYSAALEMRVTTSSQSVSLRSFGFMFEPGGVL